MSKPWSRQHSTWFWIVRIAYWAIIGVWFLTLWMHAVWAAPNGAFSVALFDGAVGAEWEASYSGSRQSYVASRPSGTPLIWRIETEATWFAIPLWIVFAPVGLVAARMARRRRRPTLGLCQRCGYNLRGNVGDPCPECGEETLAQTEWVQGDTESRRARNAIMMVYRYGDHVGEDDWAAILLLMQQFTDRKVLVGAPSQETSDTQLSLVWSVIGDAHRELGSPAQAAEAYCTAVGDFRGNACSDYYAGLVLEHNLDAHYSSAHRAIIAVQCPDRKARVWLIPFAYMLSLWIAPRSFLDWLKQRVLRPGRRRELERRMNKHLSTAEPVTSKSDDR